MAAMRGREMVRENFMERNQEEVIIDKINLSQGRKVLDNIIQEKEISLVDSRRKQVEQAHIVEIKDGENNLLHGLPKQNGPKNEIEAGLVVQARLAQ